MFLMPLQKLENRGVKLLLDEEEFPAYKGQLPPFEWTSNDTTRVDATLELPKGGYTDGRSEYLQSSTYLFFSF